MSPQHGRSSCVEKTYNLFLNVVALEAAVEKLQSLGCLIEFSFAGEPPWRFREENEDESDKADHRPLETRVSFDRAGQL